MTGTVVGHDFAHVVVELLAVFALVHVDEVDDDDAAHVAQTQLTRYLVGGTQVDFESVALLIVGGLGAVARVDVDDMEGFGMLDDDICTRLERHRLAER